MSSRTTCPYCHQTKVDKTVIPPLSPHSSADEIAYIQAETRRIDGLIAKLHEDRTALLRRLNAVQPTTRVLFPETLSLIFQHACTPPDHFQLQSAKTRLEDEMDTSPLLGRVLSRPFHLDLASVSSHWREVVHSTPNLWTSIQIEEASLKDVRKWAVFLKMSFEKSGTLPLDIVLERLQTSWEEEKHMFSPDFDDALSRNSYRIRSFCLRGFIPQKCFSMVPTFPKLVDLVLDEGSELFLSAGPSPSLAFPLNPLLRRLHLITPGPKINLGRVSASLTVLILHFAPIDLCMEALVNCPRLIEFRHRFPLEPEHDHAPKVLSSRVSLTKLEILEWPFGGEEHVAPWTRDLLTYVEVPSLKTLRWAEDCDSEFSPMQFSDLVTAFLERLPLTLEALELVEVGIESLGIPLIMNIQSNTRITSIVFKECSECLLLAFLVRLQRRQKGEPITFPRLESICCTDLIPEDEESIFLNEDIGPSLATMLEKRHDILGKFTFSHKTDASESILRFNLNTLQRFWRLVKCGLTLTIMSDGVDILHPA